MAARETPRKIGKYEIIEQIGAGGFGAVFKARDPFIKRFVAVKTCHSDNPEIRQRFFQEAEIAGRLAHRNITTVYDFGIAEDWPYLVQEYLSGEDLDHKIQRRDFLPFPEQLYYLLQVARGLAHAHRKGVIHRDIKPANIRILDDGTAKILDFGIAKLAQQQSGLTEVGMTLGTAAYLAPEQIQGNSVSDATDIFSFGVTAYELIVGQRPFKGEQISAVLYQILHQRPPRVEEQRPEVPKPMAQLIERCLAKDPKSRFCNGRELLEQLEQMQRQGRVVHETRSIDTSALTTIAAHRESSPPPASEVASQSSDERLDQIVLDPAAAAAGGSSFHAAAKPRRRALWTALLLAAAAAAALGWQSPRLRQIAIERGWLALSAPAEKHPGPTATTLSATSGAADRQTLEHRDSAAEASSGIAAAADRSLANGGGRPSSEQSQAVNATSTPSPTAGGPDSAEVPTGRRGATEAGVATTGATEQPATPTANEPRTPAKATLIVPAVAWTDAMTVRFGRAGRLHPLTRQRVFELNPGTYRLNFNLRTAHYSTAEEVLVRLGEGERLSRASPIAQPGALSVRARPGRPQGQVSINGADSLPSPVSHLWLAPAHYLVEIRPLSAGTGKHQTQAVAVESGRETIVTFDLESGLEPTVRSKALQP